MPVAACSRCRVLGRLPRGTETLPCTELGVLAKVPSEDVHIYRRVVSLLIYILAKYRFSKR